MLNELQKQDLQGIAALGRNEDTFLAHVAPDEMVVPAQVLKDDPLLNTYIRNSISKYGVDPNQFVVGNGDMDLNPMTGLPEFGFVSKLVKKVKKAVKKVVKPVAQVAQFVPGPWQAPAALISKASTVYDVAKGRANPAALLTVAGPLRVGPGIGESLGAIKEAGGLGATFGNIGSALKSGIGSFAKDPFGTIGGLFKGGGQTTVQPGDSLSSIAAKEGTTVAELLKANPQITNPNLIQAGASINLPGAGGLSRLGGGLQKIGQGVGSLVGPQTPYEEDTGYGQSQLGRIEDFAKMITGDTGQSRTDELLAAGYTQQQIDAAKQAGTFNQLVSQARASGQAGQGRGLIGGVRNIFGGGGQQQGVGGLFQGLAGGNFAIPALTGLAAYMAAKREEGGLAETPLVTMDPLGRYQLAQSMGTGGTREEFGLAPAPAALQFATGDVVEMEDYINELTNQLVDAYKKDKKYKESSFLPSSYIMSEEEQAKQERKRKNMTLREAMDEYRPSYNLLLMARKILTGETGDRIPQAKIDEIKDMVRSSIKEKQMAQLGFKAGGSVMMQELDMRQGGESIGPGTGTSDDIPAMLSDGEFVMTAKATRGAGAYETKKTPKGIELIKSGDPSRDAGVENMRELMKMFEAV